MRRILLPTVVLLLAACGGSEPSARTGPFAYDPSLPLGFGAAGEEVVGGARVVDLGFENPPGPLATAYLVLPLAGGPFPVALIQHGGGGTRDDFVPEALLLARRGAASLLLQTSPHTGSVRELVVGNVLAWRRAIDLLETLPEIDAGRIAFLGYSYGGGIGGLLAGSEPRIGSFVIAAGIADWRGAGLRELAPPRLVARARRVPFFFQAGRDDVVVPPGDVRRYYAAVGRPKRIVWYEAGHELGAEAREHRVAWIAARLGLR